MKPWTDEEKAEIEKLKKAGKSDNYIIGWMKMGRKSNKVPPITERSEPMATKKKKVSKKAAKKKVAKKKVAKKTPARKPAKKAGRKKGGFQVGEKIVAVTGLDDTFYKQFPRYKAYELLDKKGKTGMQTTKFVDAIENLEGVKSRAQALGILTKLLDKGAAKASGQKKAA